MESGQFEKRSIPTRLLHLPSAQIDSVREGRRLIKRCGDEFREIVFPRSSVTCIAACVRHKNPHNTTPKQILNDEEGSVVCFMALLHGVTGANIDIGSRRVVSIS